MYQCRWHCCWCSTPRYVNSTPGTRIPNIVKRFVSIQTIREQRSFVEENKECSRTETKLSPLRGILTVIRLIVRLKYRITNFIIIGHILFGYYSVHIPSRKSLIQSQKNLNQSEADKKGYSPRKEVHLKRISINRKQIERVTPKNLLLLRENTIRIFPMVTTCSNVCAKVSG